MKSEKAALCVALIASILALVISMVNFMGSPGAPPSAAPRPGGPSGGFGGGMRGPAEPSPEYIAKFEEKLSTLRNIAALLYEEHKAGNGTLEAWSNARSAYDEARLALQRIRSGRRNSPSFVDSMIRIKLASGEVESKQVLIELGTLSLSELMLAKARLNDAELRLLEQSRRVDPEAVRKAREILKDYPAELTDAQIEALIELEPVRGGR